MSKLLPIALAPTLICAIYVYIRDKYEHEPIKLLFPSLLYGVVITVPIVHTENFVMSFIPNVGVLMEAFYLSFIVAALVEELFKYVVLFFLVWHNNNFNEKFDGIVYSVFISLGFAGIENILYVFNPAMGGLNTAVSRAIFSVPGHALFGVAMGYFFAISKYEPNNKKKYFALAFVVPWVLHGFYDFILMSNLQYLMAIFIPFVIYLWISGFRKMKRHIASSPFKRN